MIEVVLKILLAHNYYSSSIPSGENQVVADEKDLLKKQGNCVKEFSRHNDEIISSGVAGKIKGAASTPWNPWMAHAMRVEVKRFCPDLVHVHNTFPLISASIFPSIGKRVATILTLHNYRLFCSAAIPMRNGKVCTECLDERSSLPSLKYGCYRNSRVATLPLATSIGLHRLLGTWKDEVDAFIVLSNFQREVMIDAGLPSDKVFVKPNFYSGNPEVIPWSQRKPYAVFAGRLSQEKGVKTLIHAWKKWGVAAPELHIIGDGELRESLEKEAQGLPIIFYGRLSPEETQQQIANSKLLVLPSEWFETFGLTIVEAFAHGTPAAVSNIGPLSSIVTDNKTGIVFEPFSPDSIFNEISAVWNKDGALENLAIEARKEFEKKYTKNVNYEILMDIYQKAISNFNSRIGKG